MRKRCLFAGLLAICFIFLLASCGTKAADISLRGQKTSFVVGDEFTTDGLVVVADIDGTPSTVTSSVTIDSSMVDMSKPGSYAVMVTYEGTTAIYNITVSERENIETLESLQVNTTNTKTRFVIGETFSYEGLTLIATYTNSVKAEKTVRYESDLSHYTVELRDADREEMNDHKFTLPGTYYAFVVDEATSVYTSYELTVTTNPETVADAISLGVSNKNLVKQGTVISEGSLANDCARVRNFEYGDSYMKVEFLDQNVPYADHYSITTTTNSNGQVTQSGFGLRLNESTNLDDRSIEVLHNVNVENATGLSYGLFAETQHYYSAESLLAALYAQASENANCDFEETSRHYTTPTGQSKYEYSFKYGYFRYEGSSDIFGLYMVEVNFTLGENQNIETMTVDTKSYRGGLNFTGRRFRMYLKGDVSKELSFTYNGQLMYENPNGEVEYYEVSEAIARIVDGAQDDAYSNYYSITQEVGERTIESQYTEENSFVTDYSILNAQGQEVTAQNSTYYVDIEVSPLSSNTNTNLSISNIEPSTAATIDLLTLSMYDPNRGTTMVDTLIQITDYVNSTTAFQIYYNRQSRILGIRAYTPGEYRFSILSEKTTKNFVVNVNYLAPTSISPQEYIPNASDPSQGSFIRRTSITTYVGRNIVFNALPTLPNNFQTDPDFVATCSNSLVTLTETSVMNLGKSVKAYNFTTSVAGTYRVVLTSTRNSNVTCNLTITVQDLPDFSSRLVGDYTFTDVSGTAGTLTFVPNTEGTTSGVITGVVNISIGDYSDVVSFTFQGETFGNVSHTDEGAYDGRVRLSLDSDFNILLTFSFNNGACYNSNVILTMVVQ